MTDTSFKFSFLLMNNLTKGIHRAYKEDEVDAEWLEKRASAKEKKEWTEYLNYYKKVGVTFPKVKYPVMFGKGDNSFLGTLAMEDIGQETTVVSVPSSEIINSKKAFYCEELRQVFYDNPQVFGKHTKEGEDNVFHTFILWEIQKKEKSHYYPMIKMWPKKTDILMNWPEEDLEWLQDPTLSREAQKQYDNLLKNWN